MGKKDRRFDGYIEEAAEFARPILTRFRALMHRACPDVSETIKWSFPHFEYKGVLCSMAAFKAHCRIVFWKSDLIKLGGGDARKVNEKLARLTSVNELPTEKLLLDYIREAVNLNESGVKRTIPPRPKERKELVVPKVLADALKKNAQAAKTFEQFSYSHKKEYVKWIAEARREETQKRRLELAITWLAEGKSRDWKYERSRQ